MGPNCGGSMPPWPSIEANALAASSIQHQHQHVICLAQIRLNLANVEHFLRIACSLADDNTQLIGRQVRQAAQTAFSSAQLIDHLRSLFGHQVSIMEQTSGGCCRLLGQQNNNQQDNDLRDLFLQQQQSSLHQFQQIKPHQQQQRQSLKHEQNLHLFSYSNKRTLEMAAKCLVANVAKILYLADSVLHGTNSQPDGTRAPFNLAAASVAASTTAYPSSTSTTEAAVTTSTTTTTAQPQFNAANNNNKVSRLVDLFSVSSTSLTLAPK